MLRRGEKVKNVRKKGKAKGNEKKFKWEGKKKIGYVERKEREKG